MRANAEVLSPQNAYIRNSVGTILNNIASPDYIQHIAQLFDLNTKIAIFNQTASKAELLVELNYIENPYYESTGTAFYSNEGKSICLSEPLEDDRNQRCLQIKI